MVKIACEVGNEHQYKNDVLEEAGLCEHVFISSQPCPAIHQPWDGSFFITILDLSPPRLSWLLVQAEQLSELSV